MNNPHIGLDGRCSEKTSCALGSKCTVGWCYHGHPLVFTDWKVVKCQDCGSTRELAPFTMPCGEVGNYWKTNWHLKCLMRKVKPDLPQETSFLNGQIFDK